MSRPETGDGYGYQIPDDYDHDAWQQFTPYRLGDESSIERRTVESASWWTETPRETQRGEQVHRFREGERVSSTRSVGGALGSAVPAGTEGRVVSVRHGLFDELITVEFANGYSENVKPSDIKFESGWF